MNARGLRRYVDDLLGGRRPKPFQPDDFDAAQIRTAIDLQAARLGSDAPRQEFLTDLQRRLTAQLDETVPSVPTFGATRRYVIVGTSAAAAAAVVAVSVDRSVIRTGQVADGDYGGGSGELTPNTGRWLRVAASAEVPDGPCTHSTSARSLDSSAASTASSKPYRVCALIKGADCGSTHLMIGCAARAIQRRFHWPVRC